MFFNYIKIAYRNLQKHKIYFILNIAGLSLGLALFLSSAFELDANFQFDAFHEDADRIYGVIQVHQTRNRGEIHYHASPGLLLQAMLNEFPEIETGTRFFFPKEKIVRCDDKIFYENKMLYCDPNILSMLTFPLLHGDKETVLTQPNSIVLTEESAYKYFGDKDPIGKMLSIDKTQNMIVTGVLKDIPKNSSLRFDFLVSMNSIDEDDLSTWFGNEYGIFIKLPPNNNHKQLEEKFPEFIKKHIPDSPETPSRMYLYPLLDFHLKAQHIASYLYIDTPVFFYLGLALVTLFLFVICFNFMNLSIARYINRSKEVVMRKVVGAKRSQLIKQFLSESLLTALIAYPVAIIIFQLIQEPFYTYFNNYYDILLWDRPLPLFYALIATLVAGIISGSYPAFFISAYQPAAVLKSNTSKSKKGKHLRKILIVVQFAVAMLMIIFSMTVRKQFNHLMNKDLKFNMENVISIPIAEELKPNLEPFKKELLRHPDIVNVSSAAKLPFNWESTAKVVPQDMDGSKPWSMKAYGINYDFIELFQVNLLQGRSFSLKHDDKANFIITKTAAEQLRWENPIGKELVIDDQKGVIIGVTEDFHFRSLIRPKSPSVLFMAPENVNYIFAKTTSEATIPTVTDYIKNQWNSFATNLPFESDILQHRFENSINGMIRLSQIVGLIGIITIIVSCIGLLGMVSYTVNQRTKEIGIRKVLDATAVNVTKLIISNFLLLVVLSNIIAWPLAFWGIKQYLEWGFADRINMPIELFALAGFLTLIIAFIAIIFNVLKAARANPVVALKYE